MKRFSANMLTVAAGLCMLFVTLLFSAGVKGQTKYQSIGGVKITIEGTSNIHDWDMKSAKGFCSVEFMFSSAGHLAGLSGLSFSIPAESLKSEHKSMDKNTYKALNTDKHNNISFVASSATITPDGKGHYTLVARGNLTISGVTRVVELTAVGTMNADKSFSYTGSYKLKMTDFKVTPPTMMFGAIKTGDAVTIKFELLLQAV